MMGGMVEGLREKERMQLCLVDIKILSASYMSGILPIGRAEITRNYSSSFMFHVHHHHHYAV
jgi:hypothetical protein